MRSISTSFQILPEITYPAWIIIASSLIGITLITIMFIICYRIGWFDRRDVSGKEQAKSTFSKFQISTHLFLSTLRRNTSPNLPNHRKWPLTCSSASVIEIPNYFFRISELALDFLQYLLSALLFLHLYISIVQNEIKQTLTFLVHTRVRVCTIISIWRVVCKWCRQQRKFWEKSPKAF